MSGRMTPRRKAKRDLVEGPIIAVLKAAGATVEQLDRPVDLVVGYRSKNILIECKTPGNKLNSGQREFVDAWKGQVAVCHTPAEALEVIGAMAHKKKPPY